MHRKSDMRRMAEIAGPVVILAFAVFAGLQIYNNSVLAGSGTAYAFRGTIDSADSPPSNGNPAPSGDVKEVKLQFKDYNYYPDTIYVKQGQKVRLVGDLDSENRLIGCYSFLRIPDLGIAKRLVQGDNVIEFTADNVGTINFACGMNMGRGQIIVHV